MPEPTLPVAQPATDLSNDPDFLGGTRLFSAWLDHQVSYRGLPGVVVGVVHDQKLIWQKGFGFADVKHLPLFKGQPAGKDGAPITIEQLLSHSSGLQDARGS